MPWTNRIRSRASRLAMNEEPPTLPGVFLDRGAYRPGVRRATADARSFEILDLALRCGAQLLARGAAAVDVESAVHAAATTLGLEQVEVDITYNTLWVSAVVNGQPVATSRVARQGAADYERLTHVHQLLVDIVAGDVGLTVAKMRMDEIETARRTHGFGVVLLANAVLAGAVALSLGAGYLVALLAAATGLAIIGLSDRLAGPRVPMFFLAGAGGALAVATTAALTRADIPVRPSLIVAASIVVLLPSVSLVASVRDALVGFPLTATGRAVDGIVIVVGIVTGVVIAVSAVTATGIALQIIPEDDASSGPFVIRLAAAAVAAGSAAIVYQADWRRGAVAVAVGAVGFAAFEGLSQYVTSSTTAVAGAAVLIGMVAGVAARRAGTLALVFVVPGILPLLPGLVLYRGSLLLTSGETVAGIVTLLEAGVTMLALAAGALLGELFVSRNDEDVP